VFVGKSRSRLKRQQTGTRLADAVGMKGNCGTGHGCFHVGPCGTFFFYQVQGAADALRGAVESLFYFACRVGERDVRCVGEEGRAGRQTGRQADKQDVVGLVNHTDSRKRLSAEGGPAARSGQEEPRSYMCRVLDPRADRH